MQLADNDLHLLCCLWLVWISVKGVNLFVGFSTCEHVMKRVPKNVFQYSLGTLDVQFFIEAFSQILTKLSKYYCSFGTIRMSYSSLPHTASDPDLGQKQDDCRSKPRENII